MKAISQSASETVGCGDEGSEPGEDEGGEPEVGGNRHSRGCYLKKKVNFSAI